MNPKPKYRILSNGIRFRVQMKMFGFWFYCRYDWSCIDMSDASIRDFLEIKDVEEFIRKRVAEDLKIVEKAKADAVYAKKKWQVVKFYDDSGYQIRD